MDGGEHAKGAKGLQLWRVEREGCGGTLIAGSDILGEENITSPMLAETKDGTALVYVATKEILHEFKLKSDWTRDTHTKYALSDSDFISSPILDVQRGQAVLVSAEGDVHIVKNTKAVTYGSHIWPRMRRDNSGTAYNNDSCN